MPVSTVFEKSMEMSNRHEHLDRSWLAALLGRGAWAELGAVGVHAALAAAPLAGGRSRSHE